MEEEDPLNLMVNYLPNTFTADDVKILFSRVGPLTKCKLIRNQQTNVSLGYAFIEYASEQLAAKAISLYNGYEVDGKKLKVGYARPSSTETKNRNVYVANMSSSLTEKNFRVLFSAFGSIESLKLLTSANGVSRGAGLIRYKRHSDALAAIETMNGKTLDGGDSNGPLVVKLALPPKQYAKDSLNAITTNVFTGIGAVSRNSNVRFNPMANNNTTTTPNTFASVRNNDAVLGLPVGGTVEPGTLYVYGLQPTHSELTLYELFAPFGGILNVKVVRDLQKAEKPCKGFGFVNFARFDDAHRAILSMNNLPYDGKLLQVSFKQNKSTAVGKNVAMTNPSAVFPLLY